MRTKDIILHLMRWLPEYTNLFSTYLTPLTVNVSGDLVTVNFSSDHGITDGSIVVIKDALVQNSINSIVDSGDGIIFTTTLDHDITFGYTETVNLSSVSTPAIDGDYTIVNSDNRRTFVLDSFPDITAPDIILNEPLQHRNINGLYNVTVTGTNQITFTLPQSFPVDPIIKTDSVQVLNSIRISGGASLNRIIKSYDEQPTNDLWGFVILGDSAVSKDRNVQDDPPLEQGNLNNWGVLLMQDFSVFIFVPSKNASGFVTTTGRASRDLIEDLRPNLYKAILGTEFDTGLAQPASSTTVPVEDGIQSDLDAYMIYRFQFQQVAYIGNDDVIDKSQNVSLRNLDISYLDTFNNNDNVIMTAAIDTDVNPV